MLVSSYLSIPIGMACNLNCRYCFRAMGKTRIPRLNDLMRGYLEQLDTSVTKRMSITGGEPLLYLDRVKEILSVNDRIHKIIITNGTLLSDETLKYFNDNHIEMRLSHDGPATKNHRGVDIFETPDLLNLVRQAEQLSINCVVTNQNTNCMETLDWFKETIGRDDFIVRFMPLYNEKENADLLKGFDYAAFAKTNKKVYRIIPRKPAYEDVNFKRKENNLPKLGINILPNGDVVSCATLVKYGTVNDSAEIIYKRILALDEFKNCRKNQCQSFYGCVKQYASPHYCRVRRLEYAIEHTEV